jgi:hypothetical protein
MTTSQALDERDTATLERAIKRYQSYGLDASLNIDKRTDGKATILQVDPRKPLAPTYQFEIYKFVSEDASRPMNWVIHIAHSNGLDLTMDGIGRVSSDVLVFALTQAEKAIAEMQKVPMPSLTNR